MKTTTYKITPVEGLVRPFEIFSDDKNLDKEPLGKSLDEKITWLAYQQNKVTYKGKQAWFMVAKVEKAVLANAKLTDAAPAASSETGVTD